jgi:hypothetical protein
MVHRAVDRNVKLKNYIFVTLIGVRVVHWYNETNVIHFSFSLLRIKGLYMFRSLLAHPQDAVVAVQ